jgi:hypothetical protein
MTDKLQNRNNITLQKIIKEDEVSNKMEIIRRQCTESQRSAYLKLITGRK